MDPQEIRTARDWKGDRVIEGTASTATTNTHSQSLHSGGCLARLPVPVLWCHNQANPIGEITFLRKSDAEIRVRCEIFRTAIANLAWKEITAGRANAFSIGAAQGHGPGPIKISGVNTYTTWELGEVSVCPAGANPDCTFIVLRDLPRGFHGVPLKRESLRQDAAQKQFVDSVYTLVRAHHGIDLVALDVTLERDGRTVRVGARFHDDHAASASFEVDTRCDSAMLGHIKHAFAQAARHAVMAAAPVPR